MSTTLLYGDKIYAIEREIMNDGLEILDRSVTGPQHWYLLRRGDGAPFIRLFMARRLSDFAGTCSAFDEAEWPLRYNCPLRFLDAAPVTSQGWRSRVTTIAAERKASADRRKVLVPGCRVRGNERVCAIVERSKTNEWVARDDEGRLWTIPADRIMDLEILG